MTIEICKSFDRKVQVKQFEPASFFCSMKTTCDITQAEEVGRQLYEACRKQVESDMVEFLKLMFPERYEKTDGDPAKIEDIAQEEAELDLANEEETELPF